MKKNGLNQIKKNGALLSVGKKACLVAAALSILSGCGAAKDAEAKLAAEAETAASAEEEKASQNAQDETGEAASDRLSEIKKAGKITMATSPDFAPFEFENIVSGQKEYVGADIELAKYIADKIGVELEIEAMDFASCQAAVTTGAVDMSLAGYSATPERRESMGLSHPYSPDEPDGKSQGILIQKDRAAELNSAEAFNGLTVAAQNGALQQGLVTEQLPGAKMETITAASDAVMMLKTGKVDGFAIATKVGNSYAENYPDLVMSDFYFTVEETGSVVAVPKGEDELLSVIDEAVDEAMEQGLYKKWYDENLELAASLGLNVD